MPDFIDKWWAKQYAPFSLCRVKGCLFVGDGGEEKVEGMGKIYSFETGKLIQTISYVHGIFPAKLIEEMPY
jgi:hypothetical protein